jgi:hypothetical protein
VVIAGERGELEALGTLGAHGAGELRYRPVVPRGQVDELTFSVENPYLAQLRAFTERVAVGRHPGDEDSSLVANVSILDRICDASRRSADE